MIGSGRGGGRGGGGGAQQPKARAIWPYQVLYTKSIIRRYYSRFLYFGFFYRVKKMSCLSKLARSLRFSRRKANGGKVKSAIAKGKSNIRELLCVLFRIILVSIGIATCRQTIAKKSAN